LRYLVVVVQSFELRYLLTKERLGNLLVSFLNLLLTLLKIILTTNFCLASQPLALFDTPLLGFFGNLRLPLNKVLTLSLFVLLTLQLIPNPKLLTLLGTFEVLTKTLGLRFLLISRLSLPYK